MYETENKLYFIKKNEGESNTFYYLKCEFLSKCKLNKKNVNECLILANAYANYSLNKCIYNDLIKKKINNIMEQPVVYQVPFL